MGFSGSVNGTTKTQVFWILVFANVNGPNYAVRSTLNVILQFVHHQC